MGGASTKEEIIAKLDDLDKEELEINKELRELQIQLNQLVPEEERLKVLPLNEETEPQEVSNEDGSEEIEEEEIEEEEEEENPRRGRRRGN